MKYIVSIAILALLGSTNAIRVRDFDDDDEDTRETLKSIETAEKAHNVKFEGLSKEDEKVLINSKNMLNFDDHENFKSIGPQKQMFLGLQQQINYPEARPIGEVLMQLRDEDQDMSYVAQNVDDQDEISSTLDSIKDVERQTGKEMKAPVADEKFYEIHGNKYENLMADNNRVSIDEIDDAMKDKIDAAAAQKIQQKKLSVVQTKAIQAEKIEKTKQQRAFEAVAIHFSDNADDINNEEW
jgi:hypothetical protein